MSENEKDVDAGVQYGIKLLEQMPKGDPLAIEANITSVLITFWAALWGTSGTEFARGFIESQLRDMEAGNPHETYTKPRSHWGLTFKLWGA